MSQIRRKLMIGWIGVVALLIGVLLYAQFNAARNYDLESEPAIVEARRSTR